MMHRLKRLLPLGVVLLGLVIAVGMIRSRKPAPKRAAEVPVPLVRVVPVERGEYAYRVISQGTIAPVTAISLVAEVSGRVLSISPAFEAGGTFAAGQTLVTLDPLDYEAAVERARVTLRQAERRLAEEEALADVAKREWDRIGEGQEPTPLTLREPQLAEARAQTASASKALEQAERDLDRTRMRVPFDGRVQESLVDVGQYVTRGTSIGRVYALDAAEVRLPLPSRELAYLELPGSGANPARPEVTLTAELGGRLATWRAALVRTEGEIDPRTRLVTVVARLEDGFRARGSDPGLPLTPGLFVQAAIEGRRVEDAAVLPRAALRAGDRVLVVDPESRLRYRDVEVLRTEESTVVLGTGLVAGERVCISPLDVVVEGMQVRVEGDLAPADTLGRRASS